MSKRPVAIILINVIVFCVFAEIVSLVFFHYQHGWLFYVDPYRQNHALIPETPGDSLTREGLHPYFGQTHKPGSPFDIPERLRSTPSGGGGGSTEPQRPARVETNNFGFASPHDYPFRKTRKEQFTIGMFGGSVGLWFCHVGAYRLIDDLKQHGFFRNRELIALCLSHEGYKQPQQLQLLSYFLSIGQQFDLVLNIDGFNDVALSSLNDERGLDISMPSAMHLDPMINLVDRTTLTPAKLQSLAAIARYRQQLNALASRIGQTRLASVNVALEQYYAMVERKYQGEVINFDKLPSNPSANSIIHVTPKIRDRPGAVLFDDIARNWVKASMLMNDLLRAASVPYVHVLQPNQYYTIKVFTEDEAKIALSNDSPFKRGATAGYPVLVEASGALKNSHVRFYDGTHIFDDARSQVYMDNCCHYTLAGNEILADFIAKSILGSPGPWQSAHD